MTNPTANLLRASLSRLTHARDICGNGLKSVLAVTLLVLAAGCAEMPGGEPGSAQPTGTPQADTDAASRAKVFTELGFEYFKRGQLKVALEEARKAVTADNRYGPAYNLLAMIYGELDEDKLAEENFRKAIGLNQGDSEAHNNYGWFLCTRGRHDEGLAQFTDALRNPLYSRPEQAMTNAALCSEQKGDNKQAEAYYVKALKLQPDAPLATIKYALLNFRVGKLTEAQRLLARYHEVAPPTPESLWLGYQMERQKGDKEQAAAYALQLRKHFPDSEEARRLTQGQYE